MAKRWHNRKSVRLAVGFSAIAVLLLAARPFVRSLVDTYLEGASLPDRDDLVALPLSARPEAVRASYRFESGLLPLNADRSPAWLNEIPARTYAFTHWRTIVSGSGAVRHEPNRSLDYEIHKTETEEILVVGFVSADDAAWFENESRPRSLVTTLYSDAWREAHDPVRIPIEKISSADGASGRIIQPAKLKYLTGIEITISP